MFPESKVWWNLLVSVVVVQRREKPAALSSSWACLIDRNSGKSPRFHGGAVFASASLCQFEVFLEQICNFVAFAESLWSCQTFKGLKMKLFWLKPLSGSVRTACGPPLSGCGCCVCRCVRRSASSPRWTWPRWAGTPGRSSPRRWCRRRSCWWSNTWREKPNAQQRNAASIGGSAPSWRAHILADSSLLSSRMP